MTRVCEMVNNTMMQKLGFQKYFSVIFSGAEWQWRETESPDKWNPMYMKMIQIEIS